MWGFLEEFWDAITSVADYPIEFFQNIGKAVAGAVGNLFDYLLHLANDLPIFVGWIADNLWNLIGYILAPIEFVFHFLKKFFVEAFKNQEIEQIWEIPANIIEIFKAIPYWDYLTGFFGVLVLIFLAIKIIHKLEHI